MIARREFLPRTLQAALLSACLYMATAPVLAQSSTAEHLQRQMDEKDKLISDLVRRVQALEQRVGAPPSPALSRQVETTPKQPARAQAAAPPAATGPGAPATDADEEQTSRALERALVREGGLVLPRGVYEIEPAFTYRHRATDALQIVTLNGQALVAPQASKRDVVESSLAFRYGLPWNSQIGVRVPYVWTRDTLATSASQQQTRDRDGLGDLEVSWTTQFMRESGRVPSLLGSLAWTSKTGSFELGDVTSPGSGFNVLQAGLTAVKRQDPMVFYGSITQSWPFGRTISGAQIDPGNTTGIKLGALLAASPETSLRFAFEASRSGKTELNAAKVPGSDSSVALLEFGFASIISARTVLDFRIGIGLTPDAPNYRVGLALPVRFY